MVRIQGRSQGILYEGYAGDYYLCEFREDDVDNRDEVYFFRCGSEKGCCGRVCCGDEVWVFPWWGWFLIALLILFAILLLLLLLYLCYRFCCLRKKTKTEEYKEVIVEKSEPPPRPKPPTPPPKPKPKPKPVTACIQTEPPPRPKPALPPPVRFEQVAQTDPEPEIVSDPVDYMDMPRPEPIPIGVHSQDEISSAVTPLLGRAEPPDIQRARILYYRPGLDEVASY